MVKRLSLLLVEVAMVMTVVACCVDGDLVTSSLSLLMARVVLLLVL